MALPPLAITRDLSVAFWVRSDFQGDNSWPSSMFLVDRDLCNAQRDWSVGLGQGGRVQFNTGTRGRDFVLTGATPIATGQWTHMAVVRDAAAGVKRIFVNGVLDGEAPFDGAAFENTELPIYAGASVCNTEDHLGLQGELDDLRIWNSPLTAAEVAALVTPCPWSQGLLLHYDFEGELAPGGAVPDRSGHGWDAIAQGPVRGLPGVLGASWEVEFVRPQAARYARQLGLDQVTLVVFVPTDRPEPLEGSTEVDGIVVHVVAVGWRG